MLTEINTLKSNKLDPHLTLDGKFVGTLALQSMPIWNGISFGKGERDLAQSIITNEYSDLNTHIQQENDHETVFMQH